VLATIQSAGFLRNFEISHLDDAVAVAAVCFNTCSTKLQAAFICATAGCARRPATTSVLVCGSRMRRAIQRPCYYEYLIEPFDVDRDPLTSKTCYLTN
jgi:hypothetical protein